MPLTSSFLTAALPSPGVLSTGFLASATGSIHINLGPTFPGQHDMQCEMDIRTGCLLTASASGLTTGRLATV